MAGVPTYDQFQAAPRGQAAYPLAVPSTEGFDEPARQVARVSQVAAQAGEDLKEVALKAADEANQTRVMEATNAAREAALKLAYDPQEGYTNVKGGDVLPRDGKPLAVDYTGKFDEQLQQIGDGLTNPAQKQAFAAQAGQLRASFAAGALEHESKEWQGHQLSVADGARELAIEGIAKAHNHPAAIDTELGGLDAAVYRLGKLKGLSGDEIVAMQGENRSAAVKQSIAAAISDNDLATAQGLYTRYGDKLTEADSIAVKGVIEKETVGRDVLASADIADGIAPVVEGGTGQSADHALTWSSMIHTESRGQQSAVSPKGAVGVAQVMPATARDVAAKHGIAFDEGRYKNDAGYNEQLGRLHFNDLLKHYGGNTAYAVAAYNAGQGRVDKAVAQGADWQAHLPGETQAYLHSVLGTAATGGQPTVRPPNLDEMYSVARDHFLQLHPDAPPEAMRQLREEVEARWAMHERSRAASDEDALKNTYVALAQNGGSFASLPASVRLAIPADKLPEVFSFAKSMQTGASPAQSDPGTYLQMTDPKTLAGMSDSQLLALKPKLTDSDWQQFAAQRRNDQIALKKGAVAAAKDAQTLDRPAINSVVNQRLLAAGLPPSPKADDSAAPHVAAVRMFVDRAILGEQAKLGRKMTEAEAGQFIDTLFIRNSATVSSFFGVRSRTSAFSLGIKDIGDADRTNITQWFQAHGVANPSDADILTRFYDISWEHSLAH